jgi:hypothetical protein
VRIRWGLLLVGFGAAASVLIGCLGAGTQCSCATAGALIPQPPVTSQVVSLIATPPCSVVPEPGPDGGVYILVVVTGTVITSTGSCQIRETLADGTVLTAELSFERTTPTDCCASPTRNVGPDPVFTIASPATPS